MSASTHASRSSRMACAVALAGTALLVLLAALVVLPPLSMTMLSLVVGAAEYSPLLVVLCLAWLLAAWRLLRGHRAMMVTVATLLLVAGAVALRPLAQFRTVARSAAAQLGTEDVVLRYSLLDAFRDPARRGPVRDRAIAYRAADGTRLTMHLYRGALPGARPTVVVIYGGAWRSGDATQGAGVSLALASRGFTVAAIDYRQVPAARFPAQLDDVHRALALLRDSSAAWQVDTTRVALLGRSSGGHLAELAAWTPRAPGTLRVRAVVALYAPFDLVQGFEDLPAPDPIGVRGVLREFVGGTPAEQPARYRDASPSSVVQAGLPPTLLLYGGSDHVVKPAFNRAAANRLRAVQVPVVQVEVPWAEHGFDMAPGGLGAQLALRVIGDFLEQWLGTSP